MSAALRAALLGLLACAVLGGCGGGGTNQPPLPGADPARGASLISYYGCGSCHQIAGIDAADGRVGPSLVDYAGGRYIVGRLTLTPRHLERWIVNPQRILPKTIMPNLGVRPAQARDIAAYLLSH
jgi:cytochrome c2